MLNTIIALILIQIMTVIIVDLSGFIESLKKGISFIISKGKFIKDDYDLHPVDCSFCLQWWIGLIYIIIVGQFNLPMITVILLLSFFTETTKDILIFIKDIMAKLNRTIYKILKINE